MCWRWLRLSREGAGRAGAGAAKEGGPALSPLERGQEILMREIKTTSPQWVGTTVVLAAPSWGIGEREAYALATVLES